MKVDKKTFTTTVLGLLPFIVCSIVYAITPATLYESIFHEECYGCLSVPFQVVVLACLVIFLVGIALGQSARLGVPRIVPRPIVGTALHVLFLASASISVVAITYVLLSDVNVFAASELGNFAELREQGDSALRLTNYGMYVPTFSFYFCIDYRMAAESSDHLRRRAMVFAILLAVLILIYSTISFGRARVLELILFYLAAVLRNKAFRLPLRSALIGIAAVVVLISVFAITMSLREGESDLTYILEYYLGGYFITPFNRLHEILLGDLKLASAPPLFYSLSFIYSLPEPLLSAVKYVFDVGPDYTREAVWRAQFVTLNAQRFNGTFIWSTGLGPIFYELGMLGSFYLLALGALFGRVFRKARMSGYTLSRLLYPHFFASLVWFVADYSVFSPSFVAYSVISLALISFFQLPLLLQIRPSRSI